MPDLPAPLTELFLAAFADGASDLFLVEGERPRTRRHGEVIPAASPALERAELAALWRACGLDPEAGRDGDASLEITPGARLRVNAYRTLGRLAAVLRPIKRTVPSFDELGLPGGLLTRWMERRSGLVLVCGPTGSGKSTTVAACLQWINHHQARHVITIEDPIEYLIPSASSLFSQREVHRDTGDFETALRQALRQNPDVIFFGEIRDSPSALAALRASETGHLVLSTLHGSGVTGVPSAMERLARLVDSATGSTVSLLAHQLIGVISQQLLPAPDGSLLPVLEYFENIAVTRKWIAEGRFAELRDFLDGSDGSHARPFLHDLVSASRDQRLDPAVARAACDRPRDFDRALRGIS